MSVAVGPLLRRWREHRRLSQLDLATEAEVSQRHLSFVETGRARPSREMVLHLAHVLDVPLRDRNTLLDAAGYAPAYRETPLEHPEMAQVRRAVEFLLERHEPYPALAMDRRWDVVAQNQATGRLASRLLDPASEAVSRPLNLLRATFHPNGLRRSIANWGELAPVLLDRVRREAAAAPDNTELQALLAEVLAYPGVGDRYGPTDPESAPSLLVPIEYRVGTADVRLFSTLVSIGSPLDITLAELTIELFFPADEPSESALRALAEEEAAPGK